LVHFGAFMVFIGLEIIICTQEAWVSVPSLNFQYRQTLYNKEIDTTSPRDMLHLFNPELNSLRKQIPLHTRE